MSTNAFGSRRVTESLRAIANYLDEGVQIAESIAPGSVVEPTIVPSTRTLGPRLTKVEWRTSSSSVVQLTPGQAFGLTATGSRLTKVREFKLVGPIELSSTTLGPSADGTRLVVDFAAGVTPQVGTYDAWVIDGDNQTFLLQNAVSVKPHHHHHGWKMGTLLNPLVKDGHDTEFVLLHTASDPRTLQVYHKGAVADHWKVEVVDHAYVQAGGRLDAELNAVYLTNPSAHRWIKITKPADVLGGAAREEFTLVAQSPDVPPSSDSLHFFVTK